MPPCWRPPLLATLAPSPFWHQALGPRLAFQTTTARLLVRRDGVPATAEPLLPPQPGLLQRLLRRLLAPALARQQALNARQLQFDHQVIAYLHSRLEQTHRHYDGILGLHSRHMAEIDERHLILQEELVAHVHDLVKRIDLVLSEAERGRLGSEFALKELRARLGRLEEQLSR